MKKMKAGLAVVVAIAAVMMLSSYVGALSQGEMNNLVLNASEVDSYKFDTNITMTMRRCMNMSKIMDENTSENTNENSSLDMPGTPCKQMGIYLVNNTMYLKLVMGSTLPNLSFWQNAGWMKGKMPEEEWESEDLLGQQMELRKCSKVELLEDEEVNGVDCYVLFRLG